MKSSDYTLEMECVRSERRGMSSLPRPPSLRGVFIHARCVKCESTEHATTYIRTLVTQNIVNTLLITLQINPLTSAPRALNSATLSLKARISVGQTKVKSSG